MRLPFPKKITFKVIAHRDQRYPTAGDYRFKGSELGFTVSRMRDIDSVFRVFVHELVEWYFCHRRGLRESEITRFDLMYEKERESGLHGVYDEPGWDERAPYRQEHIFAESIERLLTHRMGKGHGWKKHCKSVASL